jgi:hemolysin III
MSHELFFALTPLVAALLIARCASWRGAAGACLFVLGWVVQYGVSSQFHRRQWSLSAEQFVSDLDHVGILCMVGGTYAPVILLLDGWPRAVVPAALVAFLAMGSRRAFVKRSGRAEETALAIAMVCCLAPALPQLYADFSRDEWRLHWAAVAQYLLGGLAYASHWPEPMPGVFGAQEVFHLLTCTGSLCTLCMNRSIISRL